MGSASRKSTCCGYSSGSIAPMPPGAGIKVVPVWGWPFASISLRLTGSRSMSEAGRMWGRPLVSRWNPGGIDKNAVFLHFMTTTTQIFDYSKWTAQLPELSKRYQEAKPYPHIVLESFLDPEVLKDCIAEFNRLNETDGWINYKHYNEDKRGLNKIDLLPETIKATINELTSPACLQWLSVITGIKNLQKDDGLEGGGIHQSTRGGFLNIHADFTVHPHHRNWQRRGDVLGSLDGKWGEGWGGK